MDNIVADHLIAELALLGWKKFRHTSKTKPGWRLQARCTVTWWQKQWHSHLHPPLNGRSVGVSDHSWKFTMSAMGDWCLTYKWLLRVINSHSMLSMWPTAVVQFLPIVMISNMSGIGWQRSKNLCRRMSFWVSCTNFKPVVAIRYWSPSCPRCLGTYQLLFRCGKQLGVWSGLRPHPVCAARTAEAGAVLGNYGKSRQEHIGKMLYYKKCDEELESVIA